MTRQVTYDVIADGGTDRALIPILEWAIHRIDPAVEILEPAFRKRSAPVETFFSSYETGAMLIFAHRDAESSSYQDRQAEFLMVERGNLVKVIPVRMTEAWLLFDGAAIARAAGNPDCNPELPKLLSIEKMSNPKLELERLLSECSGSPSGRRKKVLERRMTELRISVAGYIEDFSPLEQVPAFEAFMKDLRNAYPYQTGT